MIITIDSNFYASPSTRLLGNYGETMSRSIAVCYPLVEGASLYKLRFLLPDLKSCYEADVTLGSMTVSGSLLAQTGKLSCQWIAAGINEQGEYTVVAKSNVFSLVVGESIESDSAEPVPTYEQAAEMFDNAVELQQKLEGTAEQIDEFLLEFDEVKEASQDAVSKVEALENAISLTSTPPIVASVQGEAVSITDSSDRSLQGLIVYGKSTQNGTPTPDAPIEIESVASPVVTISGKNLLKNTATTQTVNGVTFTVNSDGSITANGTATASFSIALGKDIILPAGDYIVSGGKEKNARIEFRATKPDGSTTGGNDVGSGVNVTITDDVVSSKVTLVVISATVFNNYTFQPMIRLASVSDGTYEPYKEGQSLVVTSNGLHGIPVTSGGNYTDSSGQQWIADELDFERGFLVKRTTLIESYNGEAITTPYISSTGELTIGATVIYSAAPIETPLTDEQKAEYSALMSYFPTTTATNDKGAGLKLSYIADTKTYVDNQFKMLFALISSN
ncbi:MAG: hypothetical protein IJC65_04685 [Oscillospiraceae bacterium]|nr:hypothetical protein [Oscillospiraceae bacterium]